MKGVRETVKSAPSTDLLVCFPSRANFALRPKSICGPGMPLENGNYRRPEQRPHLKRSVTRGGQASPLLWIKPKQMGTDISEPTSPKVTCSGQIKVRTKNRPCKSWQSVMEEIERIHTSRQHRKPTWLESIGVFKKDVVQFLTCLRGLSFDLRCFGTSTVSEVGTDDDDDEDEKYGEGIEANANEGTSKAMFSRWFMVLQENQKRECYRKDEIDAEVSCDDAPIAPPPNALLLMRCRSAPVRRWSVSEEVEEGEGNLDSKEDQESSEVSIKEERPRKLGLLMDEERMREEEEKRKKRETGNFLNSPDDIPTERRLVTGTRDPFSRSRSWKR